MSYAILEASKNIYRSVIEVAKALNNVADAIIMLTRAVENHE